MKVDLRMLVASVAALGLAGSSVPLQAAYSYCSQPFAPTAMLSKPNKPFCVTMGKCTEFDVQMYRNEISRYFDSLKRYAQQVDEYYEDVRAT